MIGTRWIKRSHAPSRRAILCMTSIVSAEPTAATAGSRAVRSRCATRTGRIVQWYGVCVDIDDLVTAQEALRRSERRYRDLFHYMPIGLTQVDASKLISLFKELRAHSVTELQTYIDEHPEFLPRAVEALEVEEVNQHIIGMFGAKNAEEMRGPITRYWQPGLSTIRRSIEARYRGEEVFQEETKVARMDGSVIDVLFTTARPGAVADKSSGRLSSISQSARRPRRHCATGSASSRSSWTWCRAFSGGCLPRASRSSSASA